MNIKTQKGINMASRGLTQNRSTPNNTQSLAAFTVVYDCVMTGRTITVVKYGRTSTHAAQIVFELTGCTCTIISSKRKTTSK